VNESRRIVLNASSVVRDVLVMGASAGGIRAVSRLLRGLPEGLDVIKALVLHRSPYASSSLVEVLERLSGQRVNEPTTGQPLPRCIVQLAPADMHLTLTPEHAVVERSVREHSTRPAVDPLFRSAAASFGPRVVGVLLTGAGDDGVLGLIRIKAAGGIALVQLPSEAEHAWMPTNALRHDMVDAALPLDMMGGVIGALARGERIELMARPTR
jgi:two-component system chemotaxis response regulator CheB